MLKNLAISPKTSRIITVLAGLTGLLYNFWLLGYWLDPAALHDSYVSVLEAPHRPYNWLFVLADVVTSFLAVAVVVLLWRTIRRLNRVLISYLIFGVSTLLDAIVPIVDKCSSSIASCGIALGQIFSFHDLTSLAAFLSVVFGAFSCYQVARYVNTNQRLTKLVKFAWFALCLTGIFMVVTIVIDRLAMLSQGLFLGSIGLSLLIMPPYVLNNTAAPKGKMELG